jgi:hypothetical protein
MLVDEMKHKLILVMVEENGPKTKTTKHRSHLRRCRKREENGKMGP